MGGENHRSVRIVVPDNRGENIIPGRRVHAADGFIQKVQSRGAAHDHNQLDFLPSTLRHLPDGLSGLNIQVLQHLYCGILAEICVKIAVEVQKLHRRHPSRYGGPLREIADLRPALPSRRETADADIARLRRQKPVGYLNQRCLSASIGSQQTHNPSRFYCQADTVQGRNPSVNLAQLFTFQYRHIPSPPPTPAAAGL